MTFEFLIGAECVEIYERAVALKVSGVADVEMERVGIHAFHLLCNIF